MELKVDNRCLYCHKDYVPNMANHYCDNCIQKCETCGDLKGIWSFGFDYNSEVYKQWKESGAYAKLPKEGHKKVCARCEDTIEPDPVKRFQRAAARLKPGQLELLLKTQKK